VKGCMRLALADLLMAVVFLNHAGNLPVGEPRWSVMIVRFWPLAQVVVLFILPVLTVALSIRDFRRGAVRQAVVAGLVACGIAVLGVALFGLR
jgi:hypothetical protein